MSNVSDKVTLVSSDGVKIEVDRDVAKEILPVGECLQDASSVVVPLTSLRAEPLAAVIDFAERIVAARVQGEVQLSTEMVRASVRCM